MLNFKLNHIFPPVCVCVSVVEYYRVEGQLKGHLFTINIVLLFEVCSRVFITCVREHVKSEN